MEHNFINRHATNPIKMPSQSSNTAAATDQGKQLETIEQLQTGPGSNYFEKTRYIELIIQLISEEMNEVVTAVQQNLEMNFKVMGKSDISKIYYSLSRLIIDFKCNSSAVFRPYCAPELSDTLPMKTGERTVKDAVKKSFLVFKNNKYFTVQTDRIAFIYIRNSSSTIVTMEQEEYPLVQSLDQVQGLLIPKQFYRINRQYLINFNAVKEVEHYFARKLFVRLIIPTPDKLVIGKERTVGFLNWMEHR